MDAEHLAPTELKTVAHSYLELMLIYQITLRPLT
jgi:hypothetical protein